MTSRTPFVMKNVNTDKNGLVMAMVTAIEKQVRLHLKHSGAAIGAHQCGTNWKIDEISSVSGKVIDCKIVSP